MSRFVSPDRVSVLLFHALVSRGLVDFQSDHIDYHGTLFVILGGNVDHDPCEGALIAHSLVAIATYPVRSMPH